MQINFCSSVGRQINSAIKTQAVFLRNAVETENKLLWTRYASIYFLCLWDLNFSTLTAVSSGDGVGSESLKFITIFYETNWQMQPACVKASAQIPVYILGTSTVWF